MNACYLDKTKLGKSAAFCVCVVQIKSVFYVVHFFIGMNLSLGRRHGLESGGGWPHILYNHFTVGHKDVHSRGKRSKY